MATDAEKEEAQKAIREVNDSLYLNEASATRALELLTKAVDLMVTHEETDEIWGVNPSNAGNVKALMCALMDTLVRQGSHLPTGQILQGVLAFIGATTHAALDARQVISFEIGLADAVKHAGIVSTLKAVMGAFETGEPDLPPLRPAPAAPATNKRKDLN